MRCYSCNCILTPQESVRKFKGSKTYTELCSKCLSTISDGIETIDGDSPEEDLEEDEESDD